MEQAAHKFTHAELAAAQPRFQHRLAVDLEGVEVDLAVGLLGLLIQRGGADRTLRGRPAGY